MPVLANMHARARVCVYICVSVCVCLNTFTHVLSCSFDFAVNKYVTDIADTRDDGRSGPLKSKHKDAISPWQQLLPLAGNPAGD